MEEELRKERAARKQQDDKIRDLEQRARSMPQLSSSFGGGSPNKIEVLEKQIAQVKQDKQREEMRRLEAESTLKTVERKANDLQLQVGHVFILFCVVCMRLIRSGVIFRLNALGSERNECLICL